MESHVSTDRRIRTEAGFTLVELLVSLAVTTVLILGALATFDFTARMNRVQLNVADMQQSLRIAQNEVVKLARMSGRGTLPATTAVRVTNNVPANTKLISGQATTAVLEGTDILTLRGVFNSSLYQVQFVDPAVWSAPDASGNGGVVVLPTAAGVPQDLAALREAARAGETLLLVSPFDTVSVAEVVSTSDRDMGAGVTGLSILFKKDPGEGALAAPLTTGMPAVAYLGCSRSIPSTSASPGRAALHRASPAPAWIRGPVKPTGGTLPMPPWRSRTTWPTCKWR